MPFERPSLQELIARIQADMDSRLDGQPWLRRRLQKKDARLVVVWVKTDPEVVHQRMIQRNSDRDIWKLERK